MLPSKINDFKNVEFMKSIEVNECYWTSCPYYLFVNSGLHLIIEASHSNNGKTERLAIREWCQKIS